MTQRNLKCIKTEFMDIPVFTFPMKVKDLVYIAYVAVRGIDREEGSVQRVLSKKRISDIKEFVLAGNIFFNTFILNWTDLNKKPQYKRGSINIPITPSAAQIIDGQHRLVGIKEAITEKEAVGDQEVLVSLCIGLKTKQAAKIFLNINTEQKPVPKSLIYDLFGEVEDDINHAINRGTDIAQELNENLDSPYYKAIKYPGAPRGAGIIDLSTVISALKPHLEPDGIFSRVNVKSLNFQKQAVLNYFKAIFYYYDRAGLWANKNQNPFLKSAGFNGAIDHLASRLLLKCAESKSFTESAFKALLQLDQDQLLTNEAIKSLDGKTARKRISDYLNSQLQSTIPEQDEYEF